jgi:hypothetical protein
MDFLTPSLYAFFKGRGNFWFDDYLRKNCNIDQVLTDCTRDVLSKEKLVRGRLFVGLANPSAQAIAELCTGNGKAQKGIQTQMIRLKQKLLNELKFEYVFLDTGSGIQYFSNAIPTDLVLLTTTPEEMNQSCLCFLIQELQDLFRKKLRNRFICESCIPTRQRIGENNIVQRS